MLKRVYRYIAGVLFLLLWGYILIKITLLSRTPSPYASYNLKLFWCLEEAWKLKNSDDWYFIVGNMLLFIPYGMVVPLAFDRMRKLKWTVLSGVVLSSVIEVIQLVFHRGLFEFDDIFNNTVGVLLGYGMHILIMDVVTKEKNGSREERVIAAIVWIVTIIFYTFSVCMGQPVFRDVFVKGKMLF